MNSNADWIKSFLFYMFICHSIIVNFSVSTCLCFFLLGIPHHKCSVFFFIYFEFTLTGFPILGVEWQKMENPDLRKAMGMTTDQKGARIRRIEPTAPEIQFLKPSDIILSFDGVNIANDGTSKTAYDYDNFVCICYLFNC